MTWVAAVTLLTAGTLAALLGAQRQAQDQKHRRYQFVDIGTLGGPASYYSAAFQGNPVLNNGGAVAG